MLHARTVSKPRFIIEDPATKRELASAPSLTRIIDVLKRSGLSKATIIRIQDGKRTPMVQWGPALAQKAAPAPVFDDKAVVLEEDDRGG